MSTVIRLKVPTEMHYAVIPMGTSTVNSSRLFYTELRDSKHLPVCEVKLTGLYFPFNKKEMSESKHRLPI